MDGWMDGWMDGGREGGRVEGAAVELQSAQADEALFWLAAYMNTPLRPSSFAIEYLTLKLAGVSIHT